MPALPFDSLNQSSDEIARSVAWGRAAGHPQYVWPDVPREAWRAALAEIQRVTIEQLAARPTTLGMPGGPDAMGVAGFTTGMGPLLGWWIERGTLRADPATARMLALHLAHGRARWTRIVTHLNDLVRALVPVSVTVLKGAHTALRYFPDPGTRPALDVDVLIAASDASRARAALRQTGYTPVNAARGLHRSEWRAPGERNELRSIRLMHAENPVTLEIHTSLAREFHGVRTVCLDAGAGALGVWPGEARARVLAEPEMLAFLALHASEELHRVRLIQLVELVFVARADAALDWDALHRVLDAAGGMRFAWPALALADRLAPGAIPASVLRAMASRAPATLRRLVDAAAQGVIEPAAFARPFAWTDGWWEHVRRAAFMLWPREAGRSPADVWEIYRRRMYRLAGRR